MAAIVESEKETINYYACKMIDFTFVLCIIQIPTLSKNASQLIQIVNFLNLTVIASDLLLSQLLLLLLLISFLHI